MAAGAFVLLLLALWTPTSCVNFYGDSISLMPLHRTDGTFQVTFHHRQNGRADCQQQSSYTCGGAQVCATTNSSGFVQTDSDASGKNRWCQSETRSTLTVSTNDSSLALSNSGCCWESNVNSKTAWTSEAEVNLGTRSDSRSLNRCPVTTTVSSLRVPQNCFTRIRLLAYDPDKDSVRCHFTSDAVVSSNITLDEATCTLLSTDVVATGVHVFELIMADYPTRNITLTYANGTSESWSVQNGASTPLCKVKLQFSVQVLPQISSCEVSHAVPGFLSVTPPHGSVLHATVGDQFQLIALAKAHHTSIHDFQVSGPYNMTKGFTDEQHGRARLNLTWTPQQSDLYRSVPVCFTAETNETQSAMRCVIVMVTQASIIQGKAKVDCRPNMMMVALEKASMPDINVEFLKLKDNTCTLTSNSSHIMASMSYTTCGTTVEENADYLVFHNEIESFELPTEVIVRRKTVKIDFSCRFPKTISIHSYYNIKKSDYIFTESSFGSFGYSFEIFEDSNFTSKVEAKAYPVQVKLMDMIYLGIQAQSELPNVKLFVESCKATPDDNPENTISYYLIQNGCLKDETVKVSTSNDSTFNFEVQAFKFTGSYDQVYITCSVILCEASSSLSRCAQGCMADPSRRRRRDLHKETASHYIVQGPLQFVREDLPIAAVGAESSNAIMEKSDTAGAVSSDSRGRGFVDEEESSGAAWIREILRTKTSTVVFASLFTVSLVVMAVIVRYFTKKNKAEDRRALIVSDWEN